MKILSINAGSSSLKFQLFEMPAETVVCSGIAERIGLDTGIFTIKFAGKKEVLELPIADHTVAVNLLLELLLKHQIISDFEEIKGIGHRIVHGGELFKDSTILDATKVQQIADLSALAPLHNPAHILGIKGFEAVLPNVPAVGVFDTAFHQTMPAEAYMYATPYEWYTDYAVRKYGFHGTSHMYVSHETAKFIGKSENDESKIIVCHLGNGGSLSAVLNGKSINTSMGFTPLAGIPMGTRSGDIDPAIIPYMMQKTGQTAEAIVDDLNKKSGFAGVSGISSDARDITAAVLAGDERAQLALDLYAKRIAQTIAAYFIDLNGCDAIAFTAGIGENSGVVRKAICDRLGALGVELNDEVNEATRGNAAVISEPSSTIQVVAMPTDEEVVIARDVVRLAFSN
ncbi:MAG: acetate kinase [Culicoidibacterales bacterium]